VSDNRDGDGCIPVRIYATSAEVRTKLAEATKCKSSKRVVRSSHFNSSRRNCKAISSGTGSTESQSFCNSFKTIAGTKSGLTNEQKYEKQIIFVPESQVTTDRNQAFRVLYSLEIRTEYSIADRP
jgi:hypothetical protein